MSTDLRPQGLTAEEWDVVLEFRKTQTFNRAYNAALSDAAFLSESYAEECGGGSSKGGHGDGYLNLANAIRKLAR